MRRATPRRARHAATCPHADRPRAPGGPRLERIAARERQEGCMFRELLNRVRAEARGERALEDVRALARFHRIQSSPGYDGAAEWLMAELDRLGLAVECENVPGDGRTRCFGQLLPEGWDVERARAWLVTPGRREARGDLDAEPLALVPRSMP